MEPSFSLIVPFWGEDPHRRQSYEYLQQMLWEEFATEPPMALVTSRYHDTTNRAAARNVLASRTKAEVLVFIDADSIPDPTALQESIDRVYLTRTWMFPFTTYYNLTEEGSRSFMDNPPWEIWRPEATYEHEYRFPGPDPVDRPPAVGGCVVVHRNCFETVHRYDERFEGWGGEDRAFALALKTLCGDTPRFQAPIYHLWHPAPEEERFGQQNWPANKKLLERYEQYAASGAVYEMTALVEEH